MNNGQTKQYSTGHLCYFSTGKQARPICPADTLQNATSHPIIDIASIGTSVRNTDVPPDATMSWYSTVVLRLPTARHKRRNEAFLSERGVSSAGIMEKTDLVQLAEESADLPIVPPKLSMPEPTNVVDDEDKKPKMNDQELDDLIAKMSKETGAGFKVRTPPLPGNRSCSTSRAYILDNVCFVFRAGDNVEDMMKNMNMGGKEKGRKAKKAGKKVNEDL
eukprot:450458-Prorocentrum_minimum.AAC.1